MPSSAIPDDILESIVEEIISEHTKAQLKTQYSVSYFPRCYLVPLLRVSKQWHAASVKHLYQSIAAGSNGRTREGQKVAEELCRTLSKNSQLAALVKKLQLGVGRIDGENLNGLHWPRKPERPKRRTPKSSPRLKIPESWTQTNIRILQLCPNVEHLEIRGFEHSELDALVDVLKEKSLVSFSITTHCLLDSVPRNGAHFSQIVDMMRKWPKLRSFRAEDFLDRMAQDDHLTFDAAQVSDCCPDLREIIITGAALRSRELKIIRAMCSSGVSLLSVRLYTLYAGRHDDEAADALSDCLRAWSPTLRQINVEGYLGSSLPLNEAITTLKELRELRFYRMKLDFGTVSKLPRLERMDYVSLERVEELQSLHGYLEDLENFPSLKLIVIPVHFADQPLGRQIIKICRRRNIEVVWDID